MFVATQRDACTTQPSSPGPSSLTLFLDCGYAAAATTADKVQAGFKRAPSLMYLRGGNYSTVTYGWCAASQILHICLKWLYNMTEMKKKLGM